MPAEEGVGAASGAEAAVEMASTTMGRTGLAHRLAALVLLLRPRQWYKNLIVLVPLVFSGNALNASLWLPAGLAFGGFCLLSGAVYAANDVVDRERDRLHPRKAARPVAAGLVSVPVALLVAVAAAAGGVLLLLLTNPLTVALGGVFLALQISYNLGLKQVLIWDLLAIALGFVLRALAGTTALEVGPPTEWLAVCTFLFAFYLALAKRRHELLRLGSGGVKVGAAARHRPVLARYTVAFIEQTMQVATGLLLAAYALYTFFGTTPWMMFTLPFAFYGIFRHNWLVHADEARDEVSLIFRDGPTLVNAAMWVLVVVAILAGVPDRLVAWLGGLA